MKADAFTGLSASQLSSVGKLILQLCLQIQVLGPSAPKRAKALGSADDRELFGSACALAIAPGLRFNRAGGQYFPL